MNTLKIYPKKIRLNYEKNIKNAGILTPPEKYHNFIFLLIVSISIISLPLFFFLKINLLISLGLFFILNIFFFYKVNLKATARVRQMELVFPDAISLMSSNLRAGITIENAFLLAARPEFAPLDKAILKTGKEISTGKEVIVSLKKMSDEISSEKISKVIELIISGLKAGGNIADLLEETSRNMKEKEIIEKKTASTILMYVIFIFVAVSIGAPVLFGLSTVLVEIVISLAEKTPELTGAQTSMAISFSKVSLSVNFIIYFSLMFLVTIDFISCFVIGIVNKGEGKTGLKYFIPILATSLSIFFIIRIVLSKLLLDTISAF